MKNKILQCIDYANLSMTRFHKYNLVIVLCIFIQLVAQAQTPQWLRNEINPISTDNGAITTDAAGNAYVASKYTAFGVLLVAKIDPQGTVLWADTLGGVVGAGNELSNGTSALNVRGIEIMNDGGNERLFIGFDSQTGTSGFQTPGIYEYNPNTGALVQGVAYVETSVSRPVSDFTIGEASGKLFLLAEDVLLTVSATDLSVISQWQSGVDPALTLTKTDISMYTGRATVSPDYSGTSTNPTVDMPFYTGSPLDNTQAPTDANYIFPEAISFTYGVTNGGDGSGLEPIPAMTSSTTPWTGASGIRFRAVVEADDGSIYVYFTENLGGNDQQGIARLNAADIYTTDWAKIWWQSSNTGGLLTDGTNVYLYTWDMLYFLRSSAIDVLVNKFDGADGSNIWSKTYGHSELNGNEVNWAASTVAIDKGNQEIAISIYTDSYNSGTPSSLLLSTNYNGEIQNYTFLSKAGEGHTPVGIALDGNRNAYVYFSNTSNQGGVFKANTETIYLNPKLVSATKDSETQITVTLNTNSATNEGNPTDFTVTDGVGANFVVSAQLDGTPGDDEIVLTVEDLSSAVGDLTVTYANNNDEITSIASGLSMLTDNIGITIDTDVSVPTMLSAARDSDTKLTITFNEPVQTNGTNPTDFTVEDALSASFVVSAQADGTPNDEEIILTVADLSSATAPLTVTYTNSNGEVSDLGGNELATDATGVDILVQPSISFSNISKTYGDADFDLEATSNSSGVISYTIEGAANGTSLSGTNNETVTLGNVGSVTVRATQAADGIYGMGTSDITLTIATKELTVTGLTGDDKVHDGTTEATASGTASLSGVVGVEDVSISGTPVFTFSSADVGAEITITTTGYTLSGADAGNYTLAQPTLSADIIVATSIEGAVGSSNLQVYPNPTSDRLHINTSDHTVTIIDINGNVIEKEVVNGVVDVSELRRGVYFIKDSKQKMARFIKKE